MECHKDIVKLDLNRSASEFELPIREYEYKEHCKYCLMQTTKFITNYYLNEFNVHTCMTCGNSRVATYENAKTCKVLLVGIELNPGPVYGPQTLKQYKAQQKKVAKLRKSRIAPKKKESKFKRKRAVNKRTKINSPYAHPMFIKHLLNVIDPFENHPPLHQLGTGEPVTRFNTLKTYTAATNADGSGSIVFNPSRVGSAVTSVTNWELNWLSFNYAATAAAPTLIGIVAPNRAPIVNECCSYITTSAQLKITPLSALTAAPGIVSGSLIRSGNSNVALTANTNTTTAWLAYPTMTSEVYKPGESYCINWVPQVSETYLETTQKIATDVLFGPSLVILLSGFPASSNYLIEVVQHGEGYLINTSGNVQAEYIQDKKKEDNLNDLRIDAGDLYDPPKIGPETEPYGIQFHNIISDAVEGFTGILNTHTQIQEGIQKVKAASGMVINAGGIDVLGLIGKTIGGAVAGLL